MYAEMTIITDDICNFVSASHGGQYEQEKQHKQMRQECVLNLFVEILAPAKKEGAGTVTGKQRASYEAPNGASLRFSEAAPVAKARRRFPQPLTRAWTTAAASTASAAVHASGQPDFSTVSPATPYGVAPTDYKVRADLDSPPDIAARLRPDPAGIGAESLPPQPELPLRYQRRRRHFTPKARPVWSGPPRPDDIFTLSDRNNIAEHVRRIDKQEAA